MADEARMSYCLKVEESFTVNDVKNALRTVNVSDEVLKIFEGISVLLCM